MMFIVALYLPWCRFLGAQCGVSHQLYADNVKCVSRDPDLLLRAARFTSGYVRLLGQEPARSKCVLLSTSKAVRVEVRGWVHSDEGHKWTVKLDVWDLGGHLDTALRGGLPLYLFGFVLSFLVLILFLPFLLILWAYSGCSCHVLPCALRFFGSCVLLLCGLVSKAAAC